MPDSYVHRFKWGKNTVTRPARARVRCLGPRPIQHRTVSQRGERRLNGNLTAWSGGAANTSGAGSKSGIRVNTALRPRERSGSPLSDFSVPALAPIVLVAISVSSVQQTRRLRYAEHPAKNRRSAGISILRWVLQRELDLANLGYNSVTAGPHVQMAIISILPVRASCILSIRSSHAQTDRL